ncbi:aspartic peptidase A1 [Irpex rosettiformis]|uniref:Aspartic peptidase A1 n=1 Tax=Irpex rosettiformis TaxID=378272 RepID=A0ACB8UK54_9APHY|nr:aspartic peptidase A1 [Irpex rosettiformis]
MHASALFSFLTLALVAFAEPIRIRDSQISFPVAKRVNSTVGAPGLALRDKQRAQFLKQRGKGQLRQASSVGNIPSTNQLFDYVVDVQIGTPPTSYSLLLDTASSNTWVTDVKFIESDSTVQSQDTVAVQYGGGAFMDGTEFNDKITITSANVVFGQSIGVATDSSGFDDVDGVLGLGPTGLTIGTLSPDDKQSIPTITDSLFQQASIPQNLVSISFEPTTSDGAVNGELTFGGTDSSKFTGAINFAQVPYFFIDIRRVKEPLTTTAPSNTFWGIDQQIRYGTSSTILAKTAGIIDTGTTLTLIATDALAAYTSATGAVLDNDVGLLKLSASQFTNLKSLFFVINGVTFEFTANAQIWPRALNNVIGGSANDIFLVVSDIGSNSGSGLDFINGLTWIERFYVALDTTNRKVGIANTPFTRATTN